MKFGIACASLFLVASSASASELIVNGGFETGSLGPWVATNSAGSSGSFYVASGVSTPLNGFETKGPASGTYYAVSDDFGPGSFALTQTFIDPLGTTSALLSFSIFVNDQFGNSGIGGRVDLLAGGSNPITGAVLATFYGPVDTNASSGPNPYISVTNLDITSKLVAGGSYQLRILAQDATGPINVGIDNVSLQATQGTPEPAMMLPAALLLGLFARRASKRNFVKVSI